MSAVPGTPKHRAAPPLVVAPYIPGREALHAGGRASARWIDLLSAEGPVELVCLARSTDIGSARAEWAHLARVDFVPYAAGPVAKAARALGDLVRLRAPRTTRQRLRALVYARLEEQPDRPLVVLHEETALWLDALPSGGPRLLDFHDVVSGHFDRDAAANPVPDLLPDRVAAEAAEVRLLARYDRVAVRSMADRARLLRLMPDAEVHLLRHPIDPPRMADESRDPAMILLTGSFRRAANATAARRAALHVYPRVAARYAGARLAIVGDGALEALPDLARRPGVQLLDRQDDLGSWYRRASLFLNPTTAGGGVMTRHLDAMVCGLPVVTTSAGVEGLDVPPFGRVAEDDEGLARACCAELATPRSAAEADMARRHILSRHGADAVEGQWRRFFDGAPVGAIP